MLYAQFWGLKSSLLSTMHFHEDPKWVIADAYGTTNTVDLMVALWW